MKDKMIDFYMDVAYRTSRLSLAKRLQVGSIIVKDDRIISLGFNGTPSGWDNNCENKLYFDPTFEDLHNYDEFDELEKEYPLIDEYGRYKLKTKREVIHSEQNTIAKLARSNESGLGTTMFVTHCPCFDCSKSIYTAGINTVYFSENYRETDGIDFLRQCGVEVIQWNKTTGGII